MYKWIRKLLGIKHRWQVCECSHIEYMHMGLFGRCMDGLGDEECDCKTFRPVH